MAGRAKIMIEEGKSAIDALKTSLPNVDLSKFKTVRMILESINALDDLTDREQIADAKKQIKQRQDELKTLKENFYETPFSEKVCDATIAKYKSEFGAAQKDMMNFQRTLLDIMVDSRLLSKETRDGWIINLPNHVPMFRAFDENEDIIDPLESIVKNTYSFIRRAEKNFFCEGGKKKFLSIDRAIVKAVNGLNVAQMYPNPA